MKPDQPVQERKRFLRWLILILGIVTLIAVFSWLRESAGALAIESLLTTNNQFQATVTNRSSRDVVCWVWAIQFKRGGVWENHLSQHFPYLGKGQLHPGAYISPATAKILTGQEPKYINVPYETTHWRVEVIWCYDERTFIERGREQVEAWLQKRPVNPQPAYHTNHSDEVMFTSGFKIPQKPLLP